MGAIKKANWEKKQEATKQAKQQRHTQWTKVRNQYEKMKKDKTLPGREETFTYKGSPVKTGKDLRTAVINTLWFKQANPNRPVTEHDGKKIFPSMQGTGHEFPSDRKPGGFQGKGNVGAMRVVTQPTKDGGTKYMGVISHDPTLKQSKDDPQRNFHHLVLPGPPLPKKPKKQGKGK